MGAEFILYLLPACDLHAERQAALTAQLDAWPDDEVLQLVSDLGTPSAVRERLRHAIEFLAEAPCRRDILLVELAEMPYPILTTGGLSWGDFPTDAACEFALLIDCGLAAQLEVWARHDRQSNVKLPVYPIQEGHVESHRHHQDRSS